jgi:hypothetical protein
MNLTLNGCSQQFTPFQAGNNASTAIAEQEVK